MSEKIPGNYNPFIIPVKGNYAIGDSERSIEIPWSLSLYSGESTVLDVGYAHAEERYLSGLLSLHIPHLHGIDLVEKHIEGVISNTMDIRKTTFDDNFFDLVFCISTLEHIGRDISRYTHDKREIQGNGDFEALKEIFRITKHQGKVIVTVPYGKEADYGWSIHYNETRFRKLLTSLPFQVVIEDYFIYSDGWHTCDKKTLEDVGYQDNQAQAAAGLACVLLKKTGTEIKDTHDKKPDPAFRYEDTCSIKSTSDHSFVSGTIMNNQKISRERFGEEIQTPDPNTSMMSADISSGRETEDAFTQHYLEFLNRTWDIQNDSYRITSHRPLLGNVLVQGRQIINSEVRRYIDPVLFQQIEFNANTVRILNWLVLKIEDLEQQLEAQKTASFKSENSLDAPEKR